VIRIEATSASIEALKRDDRQYASVTVGHDQNVYANVGLHLKGAGAFRPLDQKPSFTLKFNRFQSNQSFYGVTKLHLNNCIQDSTYISEALANELFRKAGLPAPRTGQARVYLNNRDLGLYAVVEGANKPFLRQHFQRDDGNLYEGTAKDITDGLDQDNGTDTSQVDLQKLAEAALLPSVAERWKRLEDLLDLDRFISFVAMEMLVCHWDGYAMGRSNYRLYHDPSTGRMVFIPHGMDLTFVKPESSVWPKMNSLLVKAVLLTPEGQKRYRERVGTLFTNVLDTVAITNRIAQLVARIRPALGETNSQEIVRFDRAIGAFQSRVLSRIQQVQRQLTLPFPEALSFDEKGKAQVNSGWLGKTESGQGDMVETDLDGQRVLHIKTSEPGNASWRKKVLLEPGKYRLEAWAKTSGVKSAENGEPAGAGVRVTGMPRLHKVIGTANWTKVAHVFDVRVPEIELICELKASKGEVWFSLDSLTIWKEP
jgi:hypothetical protein